jgi:MFS family permease
MAGNRTALAGLMVAEIVSVAGSEMSAVALPWLVLITTGSTTRMSAVLAAEFAGLSLLGLWGGPAAVRLGSRRMMLTSDLIRAGLTMVIPTLYWLHVFSFPALLVLGALIGAFFPGYDAARQLVVAGLVDEDEVRLTRVSGLMSSVNEMASFVGPSFGGLLIVLIGAANVLVVDAATFLCAFALVAVVVRPAQPPAAPVVELGSGEGGIRAGLRYLYRHGRLGRQVLGLAVVEVSWTAVMATLPVIARHSGGATTAGWLLGSFGAGSVVGGLASSRARRADPAVAAIAGIAASGWVIVAPLPWWGRALAVAANGVGAGLYFPRFFATVTTRTPKPVRASVMTAVAIGISLPGPVGFLGAGLLAAHTGGTTAGLLMAAVCATVGAAIVASAGRDRVSAEPAAVAPIVTAG